MDIQSISRGQLLSGQLKAVSVRVQVADEQLPKLDSEMLGLCSDAVMSLTNEAKRELKGLCEPNML